MGADIHFTIEQRPHKGGEWLGIYSTDYTPRMRTAEEVHFDSEAKGYDFDSAMHCRNYNFFNALAGVRGDGPEPNGLPADISLLTQAAIACWGADGHSHGHLPLDEFCERWLRSNPEQLAALAAKKLRNEVSKWFTLAEWLCEYIAQDEFEYRVVFWFDN